MAILFDKVPREIRDNIYQLLLTNYNPEVILGGWKVTDPRRRRLYPAILRTCKKAYLEGLPVLYEQNIFNYVSYEHSGPTIETYNPLKDKVGSMKHFKMSHGQRNVDSDIEKPLITVRFLAAAGCSLRTLHLLFHFYPPSTETYTKQPYNEDLLQAVAAVPVGCQITVVAKGVDKQYSSSFYYMVTCLGLIKQWAISEEFLETERFYHHTIHIRKWVLEPANKSTINKVPSPEGVDEI